MCTWRGVVKYAKKANKAPALQFLVFFTGQVHTGGFVFYYPTSLFLCYHVSWVNLALFLRGETLGNTSVSLCSNAFSFFTHTGSNSLATSLTGCYGVVAICSRTLALRFSYVTLQSPSFQSLHLGEGGQRCNRLKGMTYLCFFEGTT